MPTLASFKRSVKAGDELLCVENTYLPALNGTVRVLTRVGPSVVDCVIPERGTDRLRMEWPKAADVLAVTDDEITYRIGRDDHTVTLRRLTPR